MSFLCVEYHVSLTKKETEKKSYTWLLFEDLVEFDVEKLNKILHNFVNFTWNLIKALICNPYGKGGQGLNRLRNNLLI